MSKGANDIKSRLKRLEQKISKNVPDRLSQEEQRNFISEKAEAIEEYLKCTPEEADTALDKIDKINKEYRFERAEQNAP